MDSNQRGGIDLHIHSTASDGTYTPAEIIQMAVDLELEAISITDHDTLEGSRLALKIPTPSQIHLVAGVEISTQPPEPHGHKGSVHILAYGVDVNCQPLLQALDQLQQSRAERIHKIIDRLNQLGIPISLDQVLAQVGTGAAGRPHIASILIETGAVRDIDEAFGRYLSKGRPAYVNKFRLDIRQAFDLIHLAGGVPVLAHPYLVEKDLGCPLTQLMGPLCDMGLGGLEAYYPQHSPEAEALYLELAGQYNLLVTGGSDFHGDLLPDIRLGSGDGDLVVPFACYQSLMDHLGATGN